MLMHRKKLINSGGERNEIELREKVEGGKGNRDD